MDEKEPFTNYGGPFESRGQASRALRYVRDMFGLSDRQAKKLGVSLFLLGVALAGIAAR